MDKFNNTNKFRCKLCNNEYFEDEMSEEHYPARSTGNEDIVALDFIKMVDSLQSENTHTEITKRLGLGETPQKILDDIFDNRLSKPLYPNGRTARTLCQQCNTFLGKYDEAYLKFFNCDGNPKTIKGFQLLTKYQIIKAIFAKFLSIPEAISENFDFVDFIKDKQSMSYTGTWHLYFVKRDLSTDILGLKDIGTGKAEFDKGVVYELSDDKFIFNLMNFPKHSCFNMTDIFDILNKNYNVVEGVGKDGGYHAQIMMSRLFSSSLSDKS